jgi:hypothetical protein
VSGTAVLLAGCDRATQPGARLSPQAVTSVPARGPASFVTVSDSNPSIDAIVVVAGNVVSPGGVGAFRARLSYDPTALEFVDEVSNGGMMRAVNPRLNEIVVAGASATPTADTRLFALRFRVRRANAFTAVSLDVDELTDGAFVNRTRSLAPGQRGAVQFDRLLVTLGRGGAK